MKKLSRILSAVIVITMLAAMATNVLAAINPEEISASADTGAADTTVLNVGNMILTIITNVGMILAVIIIAVLGVKYMMGSTSEKAEYKKSMIPYLVGAILVFGASAIGRGVIQFGQSVGGSAGNTAA